MSPCASTQISPSGLLCAPHDSRPWPRPSRRRGCGRRRARAESRPVSSADERRLVELLADARDLADVLLRRIADRLDLGNRRDQIALVDDGACRARSSRSPSPAMRNADGPMSTPRRLPPRSSETPMMWTGRTAGTLAQRLDGAGAPSSSTRWRRKLTGNVNVRYSDSCGG